jgi:hypothetical protein
MWLGNLTSVVILLEKNYSSVMRKTSDIPQDIWLALHETVKVMKNKEWPKTATKERRLGRHN